MKAVILCGGQGTRLREESEYRPKPLVDIGGRPILWHIMKLFAHYGIRDFVLCLGYKGQMIKEYFLNYEAMNNDFSIQLGSKHVVEFHGAHEEQNFRVTLADTGAESMTGNRIKMIEKYVDNETFLLTYGDGVADVNLWELLRFHRAHGKLASVTTVQPRSRFGMVEMDDAHSVISFAEKPQAKGWASAGYFVCEPGIFQYLTADGPCVWEEEPLRELSRDGQLMGYKHDGFFYAMDTYREYLELNDLWKTKQAPWAVWTRPRTEEAAPLDLFPKLHVPQQGSISAIA